MSKVKINLGELRSNLNAAWAIAKKDAHIYYIQPGPLMFGIMFPFFMFLSFAIGRNAPAATMIPGLTAMTIFFSASSIGPVSVPLERRTKTFERLLSAPVSFYAVFLGKVLAGFMFCLAIGVIPIIVGMAFFGTQIINIVLLIIGFILPAFCFSTLGIMFASFPTENPGNIMMMLNFIRLPLLFISGIFIPLSMMPDWGRIASIFSPLTYSGDLVSNGLGGQTYYSPLIDILALLIFIVVFQVLGMLVNRRFRE
jgi:ABC-2 type transport system permease protein